MSTENMRSGALDELKKKLEDSKADSALGSALAGIKNTRSTARHISELTQLLNDGQKEVFAHHLDQSVTVSKTANTVVASQKIQLLRHALTELSQAAIIRNVETASRAEHWAMTRKNSLLDEIIESQKEGKLTPEDAQYLAKKICDRIGTELPKLGSICDDSNRLIMTMVSNAIGNNLNK